MRHVPGAARAAIIRPRSPRTWTSTTITRLTPTAVLPSAWWTRCSMRTSRESRQHDPEDPVHLLEPRPWLTRLPHGELLPQHEILHRQFAVRAKRGAQCPKKDPKPSDHDRSTADQPAKTARQSRRTTFQKGQVWLLVQPT